MAWDAMSREVGLAYGMSLNLRDLRINRDQWQDWAQKMEQNRNEWRNRANALESDLGNAEHRAAGLEQSLEEWMTFGKAQKARAADAEAATDALRAENERLRIQLIKAQADAAVLAANLDQAEDDIDYLHATVDQLEAMA